MKLACGRSRITILLFTLLVAVACGSGSALDAILEEGSVRSVIVEVVGRDLLEIERLQVRDDEGKVRTFSTVGFIGQSPSHLRQHQLLGEGILVSYVAKDEILLAVDLAD